MAHHVMGVHLNAVGAEPAPGELNIDFLKKYINYCRMCVLPFSWVMSCRFHVVAFSTAFIRLRFLRNNV